MTSLALIIAQHTQSAPDDGLGIGLIVGTIVAVIVVVALIWLVFARMTKRSRGGVEPKPGERHRGNPPVEGIERGG
jgi:hypothetical protein